MTTDTDPIANGSRTTVYTETTKVIGLVLCGGRSSRMGRDKGTLRYRGVYWARTLQQCFDHLELPSYISINPSQKQQYRSWFGCKLIVDQVDVYGPLTGVLSAHQHFPQTDIAVLACDMIEMDSKTVEDLLKIRQQIIHADAYVYWHHGRTEPCCAIYTVRGLKKIKKWVQERQLQHYSFQRFIAQLNTVYLPVTKGSRAFRNYNSPKDLHSTQIDLLGIPGNLL